MAHPASIDEAPPVIRALVDWLDRRGLVPESRRDAGKLNQVSVYRAPGSTLAVRVGADRGEWFVDLGLADQNHYTVDLWEACLAGQPAGLDVLAIEEQVATLKRIWEDVVRAPDAIQDCLRSEGMRRSLAIISRASPPPT